MFLAFKKWVLQRTLNLSPDDNFVSLHLKSQKHYVSEFEKFLATLQRLINHGEFVSCTDLTHKNAQKNHTIPLL